MCAERRIVLCARKGESSYVRGKAIRPMCAERRFVLCARKGDSSYVRGKAIRPMCAERRFVLCARERGVVRTHLGEGIASTAWPVGRCAATARVCSVHVRSTSACQRTKCAVGNESVLRRKRGANAVGAKVAARCARTGCSWRFVRASTEANSVSVIGVTRSVIGVGRHCELLLCEAVCCLREHRGPSTRRWWAGLGARGPWSVAVVTRVVVVARRRCGVAVAVREQMPVACNSYLVDPASSHMLVSKIKPCMSKYIPSYGETANGSLNQLWFLRS